MKEIEIIGKAIESTISSSKTVTTAEFVEVINLVIDSFKTRIILNIQILLDHNEYGTLEHPPITRHLMIKIMNESQDMIKELERIKAIAMKFS